MMDAHHEDRMKHYFGKLAGLEKKPTALVFLKTILGFASAACEVAPVAFLLDLGKQMQTNNSPVNKTLNGKYQKLKQSMRGEVKAKTFRKHLRLLSNVYIVYDIDPSNNTKLTKEAEEGEDPVQPLWSYVSSELDKLGKDTYTACYNLFEARKGELVPPEAPKGGASSKPPPAGAKTGRPKRAAASIVAPPSETSPSRCVAPPKGVRVPSGTPPSETSTSRSVGVSNGAQFPNDTPRAENSASRRVSRTNRALFPNDATRAENSASHIGLASGAQAPNDTPSNDTPPAEQATASNEAADSGSADEGTSSVGRPNRAATSKRAVEGDGLAEQRSPSSPDDWNNFPAFSPSEDSTAPEGRRNGAVDADNARQTTDTTNTDDRQLRSREERTNGQLPTRIIASCLRHLQELRSICDSGQLSTSVRSAVILQLDGIESDLTNGSSNFESANRPAATSTAAGTASWRHGSDIEPERREALPAKCAQEAKTSYDSLQDANQARSREEVARHRPPPGRKRGRPTPEHQPASSCASQAGSRSPASNDGGSVGRSLACQGHVGDFVLFDGDEAEANPTKRSRRSEPTFLESVTAITKSLLSQGGQPLSDLDNLPEKDEHTQHLAASFLASTMIEFAPELSPEELELMQQRFSAIVTYDPSLGAFLDGMAEPADKKKANALRVLKIIKFSADDITERM